MRKVSNLAPPAEDLYDAIENCAGARQQFTSAGLSCGPAMPVERSARRTVLAGNPLENSRLALGPVGWARLSGLRTMVLEVQVEHNRTTPESSAAAEAC